MQIHPFAAIRTPAHRVSEVSCPPYDTVNLEEATSVATEKPNSFMRVIRPDGDFDPTQDPHAPEVYRRGFENLQGLITRGYMVEEESPMLYVYRQSRGGRKQAGLVCCVSVDAYLSGAIRKHELTRPDKEEDRVQHMLATGTHCEPVLLMVREQAEFVRQLGRDMNQRPLLHFCARDGVTHTLWAAQEVDPYRKIFDPISLAYIADGHHRVAAASRVSQQVKRAPSPQTTVESQRFPAVIFPSEELVILAYHRLVQFKRGQTAQGIVRELAQVGSFVAMRAGDDPTPTKQGEVGVFVGGSWWRLTLPRAQGSSALDQLDVVRLSRTVLSVVLGIADERTDQRISFTGGCATDRLAAAVTAGSSDIAFAMFPTSIEEVIDVANANLIMPPKSTWFYPKLGSGLFAHRFASHDRGELVSKA